MAAPSILAGVITSIAVQASHGAAALAPAASGVAGSLTVLAIVLLGVTLASGQVAFLGPVVRLCGMAAGTFWAIGVWPQLTADVIAGAHAAVSAVSGQAYAGPADLIQLASDTSARMTAEGTGASLLSPSSIVSAMTVSIAAIIAYVGLLATAFAAAAAEIEVWIGAALCVVVLPFVALNVTSGLGFGAVRFLVHGALNIMSLGLISVYVSGAITDALAVGGTDQVMLLHSSMEVLGLAFLSCVLALAGYSLASKVVGVGPVFSWGAVSTVVGMGQSAASSIAAGAAGSAGRGGAGAAAGGGSGGGGPNPGGGGAARPRPAASGGLQRTSGSGNPFAA